jgi:hypothetical protein
VQWGGEVNSPNNPPGSKHTTTQMGSGQFASAGCTDAAFQMHVQYVNASYNTVDVSPIRTSGTQVIRAVILPQAVTRQPRRASVALSQSSTTGSSNTSADLVIRRVRAQRLRPVTNQEASAPLESYRSFDVTLAERATMCQPRRHGRNVHLVSGEAKAFCLRHEVCRGTKNGNAHISRPSTGVFLPRAVPRRDGNYRTQHGGANGRVNNDTAAGSLPRPAQP